MSVKLKSLEVPFIPFPEKIVGTQARIVVFIKDPSTCDAIRQVVSGSNGENLVFLGTIDNEEKTEKKDLNSAQSYYPIGILAAVEQFSAVGDGSYKFVASGQAAAHFDELVPASEGSAAMARIRRIDLSAGVAEKKACIELIDKLVRELATFSTIWETAYENKDDGSFQSKRLFSDPIYASDFIAGQLELTPYQRIGYFFKETLTERIAYLSEIVVAMLDKKATNERINKSVSEAMEKNQRSYVLNEQMKAIRRELRKLNGQEGDVEDDELVDDLEVQIEAQKKDLPEKVYKLCRREYSRYKLMQESTSEASVVRTYIETLLSVPWTKSEEKQYSLGEARSVLDEDHWGMDKVKLKVLEYLVTRDSKHPKILCLVGAPGVGKTSLCRSIARAMGRKYCRMALGGLGDEAEIRGHRRTYVGAMPGQIIKHLIKAEVNNPVFVLDEIDKMGSGGNKGDPASAMLEVLDPEQNNTFEDNYLDTPFDLSNVFFICTANSLNLPAALLDRMEVIALEGYSEDEKLNIAKRHIIPHVKKDLGLPDNACAMTDDAVRSVVRYYTRESGVRELERLVLTFIRKILLKRELDESDEWRNRDKSRDADSASLAKYWTKVYEAGDVEEILGARRYTITVSQREPAVGLVNGLSWSETGGDILQIEALRFDGTGKIQRTGLLGDCMKESVEAALSVVRARLDSLGVEAEKFAKSDWHIHFPEGAIKKDGPSAGISIATAVTSSITGIPVRSDVAMTGEICLRGDVLPIGGLKEKLLAALRGGIKTVLVPFENEKDVKEIDPKALQGLEVRSVKRIEEVLKFSLVRVPTPKEGACALSEADDPKIVVEASQPVDC